MAGRILLSGRQSHFPAVTKMMEILQFIFSSFWVWAGSVILLVAVAGALSNGFALFAAIFRR